MPYAVEVTNQEIANYVIEWMSQYNFNVDYIREDLEYDTYNGEAFYAITDGSSLENNVTFTTMRATDFHNHWYFPYGSATNFRIIDKKI